MQSQKALIQSAEKSSSSNFDGLVKSPPGRHPGESRGPEVLGIPGFRLPPESSLFINLQNTWIPVFTGMTEKGVLGVFTRPPIVTYISKPNERQRARIVPNIPPSCNLRPSRVPSGLIGDEVLQKTGGHFLRGCLYFSLQSIGKPP